jgi:hypothetical protein
LSLTHKQQQQQQQQQQLQPRLSHSQNEKVGLAIRYASNPVAAERACEIRPQAVYRKAIEMVRARCRCHAGLNDNFLSAQRVPLHQVHAFVRKFALAFVEKLPARPAPPQQGFLSRVLSYFPGADYLTRASEVVCAHSSLSLHAHSAASLFFFQVPNRGSEVIAYFSSLLSVWR